MPSRRVLFALLPGLATLSIVALSALCALCARAATPPAPAGFQLNGDPGRGQLVFAKTCALCHGVAGDGKSKMAETMSPKPIDFTNKALVDKRSDWELYVVVRDGGPAIGLSNKMLPWKTALSDLEIRDAASYVRTLGK